MLSHRNIHKSKNYYRLNSCGRHYFHLILQQILLSKGNKWGWKRSPQSKLNRSSYIIDRICYVTGAHCFLGGLNDWCLSLMHGLLLSGDEEEEEAVSEESQVTQEMLEEQLVRLVTREVLDLLSKYISFYFTTKVLFVDQMQIWPKSDYLRKLANMYKTCPHLHVMKTPNSQNLMLETIQRPLQCNE